MLQHHPMSMVVPLLVLGLATSARAASSQDACHATTKIAFAACKTEARAAKETALGKCLNVPDAAGRKACNQQAATDVQDAVKICIDGRAVRDAACARLGPSPYQPTIDPANFVAVIDNPYFPLKPGTTFTYESHQPGILNHTEFAVTNNTKTILGVTCIEVHDTVKINGDLEEDTLDWFAQDQAGNVWYFGEDTMELAGGRPTTLGGSFVSGINGAQPGIIMKAHPAIGDFYRQEFDLANAEDLADVISLTESVTVPAGTFNNDCLKTKETTPLEPDLLENKYYAPNVGNVLTVNLTTGERVELISVTP